MKKKEKKSKNRGKRASKKQLLGLAKAHEARGNKEAAAKLRRQAAGYGMRTRNPAKADKKADSKPEAEPKPRKSKVITTTTTTKTTRTSNPAGRRKVQVTLTTTGKGKKKRIKATTGQLRQALKGSGARYLDLRTGQIKKGYMARTSNPSISTGGIVSIGAGVVLGVPTAEILYRWAVTRPGAFGETGREDAWTGSSAAMRIQRGTTACALFVGGTGVVVGGIGMAILGAVPVLGGILLGMGAAHVGVGVTRGVLSLIGGSVKDRNEASFGNRIAPELSEPSVAALDEAIKGQNDSASNNEDKGSSAVSGTKDLRERIRQARQRQEARTRRRSISAAHREALGALDAVPPALDGACCGGCARGESCEASCRSNDHGSPRMPPRTGEDGGSTPDREGNGSTPGREGNGSTPGRVMNPFFPPRQEAKLPPRQDAPVLYLPPPQRTLKVGPWGNLSPLPAIHGMRRVS